MFLAVLPHRLFVETSSDIANVSSVEINDKCDVERFRNKRMQQRAPFSSNPQGSTKTPTSKSCKFHRQRLFFIQKYVYFFKERMEEFLMINYV